MTIVRKKILLAVTHAGVGGVAKHVIDLARHIRASSDWSVDIACGCQKRDLIELYKENADNLIIIQDLVRELAPMGDIRAYKNINELLKNKDYDLVHVHGAKAGILFKRVAHENGIPSIYTHHLVVYRQFKTIFNPLYKFIETRASDWCNYVVVVTEENKKVLWEDGVVPKEKLKVVYNGIADMEPKYTKEYAREQLGIDQDIFFIVTVTRLDKPKDPLTLVRSFVTFSSKEKNSMLAIIGDGNLKEKITAEVTEKNRLSSVMMPGFVRDVDLYLAAADVFCLSTEKEGLPIAILEGMKYSLPILANGVDGVPEQVKDGWNGYLIAVGDEEGFLTKLNILYRDKQLRNIQGRNSRQLLEQKFMAAANYRSLVELYDSCLGRVCK